MMNYSTLGIFGIDDNDTIYHDLVPASGDLLEEVQPKMMVKEWFNQNNSKHFTRLTCDFSLTILYGNFLGKLLLSQSLTWVHICWHC